MEERNLNTWEEFEKELGNIRREYEQPDVKLGSSSTLLFRGHQNSCWLLSTTLDRKRKRMLFKDYYRLISKIQPQIETLTGKEWSIPSYPDVEKDVKEYDQFSIKLWSGRCPGSRWRFLHWNLLVELTCAVLKVVRAFISRC
jgi:hypothetical protein